MRGTSQIVQEGSEGCSIGVRRNVGKVCRKGLYQTMEEKKKKKKESGSWPVKMGLAI